MTLAQHHHSLGTDLPGSKSKDIRKSKSINKM